MITYLIRYSKIYPREIEIISVVTEGTYRWYKDNDDKIKSLEKEIIRRKEKKETLCKGPHKKNKELDHLRKDYQFSLVCIKIKKQR